MQNFDLINCVQVWFGPEEASWHLKPLFGQLNLSGWAHILHTKIILVTRIWSKSVFRLFSLR